MRVVWVLGLMLLLVLLVPPEGSAVAGPTVGSPVGAKASPVTVADWRLDEPAGSTVMVDSSGRGRHGAVDPGAAAAGLTLENGVYHWSVRCPACPPTALPRVVQVPDNADLDIPDPDQRYSISFRFRSHKGYGNIMQKGQATTAGGQIKIENPKGLTTCVFVGANKSYVSVRGATPLNDGQWHVVECIHTAAAVSQVVDGVLVAVKYQRTGPIDNAKPFVIGGKTSCNQVSVTCDYYSGYLDWVMISRGGA